MQTRNILIAATAGAALASMAGAALAAGTVSTTAQASTTILSPFTINNTQSMVFGSVTRPATGGTNTVTLDSNDTVMISGPGDGALITSTTSSAHFNLIGNIGTTYTLNQTLAFTQTGLTGVTAGTASATTGTVGTLPGTGPGAVTQELRYGGSFTMSAATTAQTYTGNLTVTVSYN